MVELIFFMAVFVFVMAAIDAPLSKIASASKLPKWVKIDPAKVWGIPWIDTRPVIKKWIIKSVHGFLICTLFFMNFVLAIMKSAGKIFVKQIESSANGAIKKMKK